MSERREVLAEAATDYVLEHGLLDLSLRPLAAALGTSDRMLLYHFKDKNDLVATVLHVSNDRSVQGIRALRPSRDVRQAVLDLWGAVSTPDQARCGRLYVEAAALGVLGAEPFASVVGEANEHVARGARRPPRRLRHAGRAMRLVRPGSSRRRSWVSSSTRPLEPPIQIRRSIGDLADAVAAVWAE